MRTLTPVTYQDGTGQSSAPRPIPTAYTAPAGAWQHPSNFLSSANNTLSSGSVYFSPLDVGPAPKAYDRLGVNVGTAQVGGSTTFTLGLYPDDGSGGAPNTAAGPLVSGPVPLTAGGLAALTISGTLQPARYWMASLYVSTTAPTTAPLVAVISNASPGLWIPPTLSIGSLSRALVLTSQTALPTTASSPVGGSSSNIPVVAARAA